jgi:hypothetical protein
MSAWQDLYLPFSKGLDLSAAQVLSGGELEVAENTDWDHEGTIKGRPSRAQPGQFVVANAAPVTFPNTGYSPRGLVRLRDVTGERPALVCEGKTFSYENSRWMDRGGGACFKVDRKVNFIANQGPLASTQDFGPASIGGSTQNYYLLTPQGVAERTVVGPGSISALGIVGTGARCGTTTAIVGVNSANTNLYFIYRTNGGDTLTAVTLASDAAHGTTVYNPVICSVPGAPTFWVAYLTTTANTYKLLRVDITGTVQSTFTGTLTGIVSLWIDYSGTVSDRLAFIATTASGITVKEFSGTGTITDQAINSTYALSGAAGLDCTIGVSAYPAAVLAFRSNNASSSPDVVVGTVGLTTPGSISASQVFYGAYNTSINNYNSALNWGIAHQPVLCNGRMYLTLVAAAGAVSITTMSLLGTWLTLDVTSLPNFQIVARGTSNATIPNTAPASAVPLTDGTGWTFPTNDWARFGNILTTTIGLDATFGLYTVQLTQPRAALVGESTVMSGSVPRVIQRGQSAELGFPFLAGQPGLDATVILAGGGLAAGSFTFAAVWRWTDEIGVIHRSAPSPLRTVTTDLTHSNITVTVVNPVLTEKSWRNIVIELYCTIVNPTASSPHYLVQSVTPTAGAAYTSITMNSLIGPLDLGQVPGTETLYTDGSAFAQYHVPADGGVAILGRRLWMAGAGAVYASKLLVQGWAPGFNDEGSLQVNLPAGAGRILSLEAMDEKLVIFCARGVFVIADGGPDNNGNGPDFVAPQRLTDLGIAGPRSTCWTPLGVVFGVPLNADTSKCGPWLLTRNLEMKYLGQSTQDYSKSDAVPEVAFSPEREAVFVTFDQRSSGGTTGVIMLDMRSTRFAVWLNADSANGAQRSIACVNGDLWSLDTEPAPFNGVPGTDYGAAGNYQMRIRTSHLYATGHNGIGWARIRSLRPLSPPASGAHTLTPSVIMDQFRTYVCASPFAMVAGASGSTWPANRQVPEWRLPTQKCSSIQVELVATPATAQWSAIGLLAAPIDTAVPSKQRA